MSDVLYTDGCWRLADARYTNLAPRICLEHLCPAGNPNERWVAHRFNYYYFDVPCGWCGGLPPEGLQGLFAMLTDDKLRTVAHDEEHTQKPCA